jgi:hypothetical protein
MLRTRRIHVVVVLLAVTTTSLLLSGGRALAIQDSEDKVLFGPVGIGAGEGARVNVYGIGNPDTAPWEFAVRVFNRRGELAQERRFQIAPGVIGSVEINVGNPDIFPVDRLGRRTLRAEIVGFNPQPDPPGRYAATLEVYSQFTGHTSILIGNPDILPAAQIVTPPGQ